VNVTDPDTRMIKRVGGKTVQGYNVQVVASPKQIILAAQVAQTVQFQHERAQERCEQPVGPIETCDPPRSVALGHDLRTPPERACGKKDESRPEDDLQRGRRARRSRLVSAEVLSV
jgi:hypothetical protein